MTRLARRNWVPEQCERLIQAIAGEVSHSTTTVIEQRLLKLVKKNRNIHEQDCINLNPATNAMNPAAEAVLSRGLGSRPSLGYPGDKYEMGLEAIEEIEVIAAELAAQVFKARYAEIRVASGALSNLYAFMATTSPGDSIIVPSARIGGHVTHQQPGTAGWFGLDIHEAPVDSERYTVDLDGLRKLAHATRPKLITIGGSLNLFAHPVREIRSIADECGAKLLFDAAHLCGVIAGGEWSNPLDEGAHLMTMSTYKSLGGPAGGLVLTNEADIAKRLDSIAFPGMTANFDVAKSAALAVTLLDWLEYGQEYAKAMVDTASTLAQELAARELPVHAIGQGATRSHQFAIQAANWGGGQHAAKRLRSANILTCGIGLPIDTVADDLNGLRIGTPEIVRWGMTTQDMPELADLLQRALNSKDPFSLASESTALRQRYPNLHYIRQAAHRD